MVIFKAWDKFRVTQNFGFLLMNSTQKLVSIKSKVQVQEQNPKSEQP